MPGYRVQLERYPNRQQIDHLRKGLQQYNLHQLPQLANLPHVDFNIVAQQQGRIVGGAVAELDWGYLYVDTLWVSGAVRGQGYGRRIMAAAESYAAQKGLTHAYLSTTSFQARPFYEKIGYHVCAKVANRPQGHTFYYLHKPHLQITQPAIDVTLEMPQQMVTTQTLDEGLVAHSEDNVPLIFTSLAVLLYDEQSAICGGVYGSTYWNWLDIRYLWVAEPLRGRGYGTQMMKLAEREARARGAYGIVTDIAAFQAWPFYEKLGFHILGTLPDRPPSHESYIICKQWRT